MHFFHPTHLDYPRNETNHPVLSAAMSSSNSIFQMKTTNEY